MSPFIIPILTLMIAILARTVFKPWMDLQHRKMELEADRVAEKAAQYAAQTERLEQRVRVLKRIATDRGADLANEIEALRDAPVRGRLEHN
jgi:Zn-dependent protease with chaperone function